MTQYLNIDGADLPLPKDYRLSYRSVEAESSGETEAGTRQRDVTRSGVVSIDVSFQVASAWLKRLSDFAREDSLTVRYFDPGALSCEETQMWISDYRAELFRDTARLGFWNVSFTLNEF